MSGSVTSPSQIWPRIHVCNLPSRHTGTFLRAPRKPSNSIIAYPTIPNVSPMAVPPRGPPGWVEAYHRYPIRETITTTRAVIAQGRCVRSIRMNLCGVGHSARRCGRRGGFQYLLEKLVGIHAMRRVVRAGIYAAGLGMIAAEVAGGSLLLR